MKDTYLLAKVEEAIAFWTKSHEDDWLQWGYLSQGDLPLEEEELRERLDMPMVRLTVSLVRAGIVEENSQATKLLLHCTRRAVDHFRRKAAGNKDPS